MRSTRVARGFARASVGMCVAYCNVDLTFSPGPIRRSEVREEVKKRDLRLGTRSLWPVGSRVGHEPVRPGAGERIGRRGREVSSDGEDHLGLHRQGREHLDMGQTD